MSQRLWGCFSILLVLFLGVSILINLVLLGSRSASSLSAVKVGDYQEVLLEGSDSARKGRIAVVDLYGVPGMVGDTMVDDVIGKLKQAREDSTVKVVILRIDSPGGEVTASDILYHEVKKTQEVKPVVVYIETVGASGAYYAAMGSDYLMAHPLAITGSIGVILQTFNFEQLTEKIGVSALTFKSGEMKDLLNPMREATADEKQYVQDLIDDTYTRFLEVVSESRSLDPEQLRKRDADGRILKADRAKEVGLLDATGYFEDAIAEAREQGDLGPQSQVVRLVAPFTFSAFLRTLGEAKSPSIRLQVGPEIPRLDPGRLYYISPHLFVR